MKRPIPVHSRSAALKGTVPFSLRRKLGRSAGFTLIELMVATALSLLLLGTVISMFGTVSESITDSRAMLEAADRLRLAEERLQLDLAGATVMVNPTGQPGSNMGYLEYIEGPVGLPPPGMTSTMTKPEDVAKNTELSGSPSDKAIGDFDDVLLLTTHSSGRPFVGKVPKTIDQSGTIQSDVAEVAWFVRGRTLHRRVLLVAPSINLAGAAAAGFYRDYDISARWNSTANKMVANTLADLTRRECRFAHGSTFPANGCDWKWTASGYTFPTLPTLNECSLSTWSTERTGQTTSLSLDLDFWTNDASHRVADNAFIVPNTGSRVSDDIILTNIIGFDVKAWDPTANGGRGGYVDLGYNNDAFSPSTANSLSHLGDPKSGLQGSANTSRVYDTWSITYFGASANNGLDDDGNGVVDDNAERTNPPPYPIPLRGIQVKIRTFEPDSRQIREVTVEQTFLPQ